MVFSSVPLYLDHPHYQQLQAAGGNSNYSTVEETSDQYYMLAPPAMPPLQPPASAMVQMGPAVKCPRCGSGNTKFCYYNNYSLSQPRHFCKNCRRYWTRGGVLRNVPVGGGSRTTNNKTTKSRSRRSNKRSSPSSSSNSSPMMMMMMHHEQQYYHHNFMQQPNDLLHVNRRFGAHADVGPSQALAAAPAAAGGGEQFADCNWMQIHDDGGGDDGSSSTNNYKFDQGLFDGMINFHY